MKAKKELLVIIYSICTGITLFYLGFLLLFIFESESSIIFPFINNSLSLVYLIPIILCCTILVYRYVFRVKGRKFIFVCIIPWLFYILVFISLSSTNFYFSSFSSGKWKTHPQVRHNMINDLENKYNLDGMMENDIETLLGKEDQTRDGYKIYDVGLNFPDSTYFCIRFQGGKVTDYYVGDF